MKKIITGLLAAAVLTAAAASGLLYKTDASLSDRLYQSGQAAGGDIVLVGIDQRALEDIGPFQQWGRDTMAQALEYLNAGEDCHPAVIGIDVLYAGETNPEADQWLAEAAGQYGNVVTAAAAEFGSQLVNEENGNFYVDDFSVLAFDEPYEKLKDASSQGHINAMYDKDGILRRSLFDIELPDGRKIPSFAWRITEKFQVSQGLPASAPPPADSRGFWYLPYSGLPGAYDESISVADLLSGEVPADYFDGKIVLIGPYAAGLNDTYVTAIDHAQQMYGVEYQANAVEALLSENYKTEVGDSLQLLVLFILAMLCVFAFQKFSLRLSACLWVLLTGGWVLLAKILYGCGLILHVLWIPAAVTILFIISVAVNYVRAAMEKRRVTATFKRYVAPEIVNELLKEGTDSLGLGGKLCEIAVLFVDIRGFTTMSEVLTPEQVVEILNRYLTLTSSCIMKNGGTLDKFIGDATMAFWGAPLKTEDFVMKAAHAAMDMVEGSKTLSKELEAQFGRTVSFGIGIHVGPAVVGNIGALNRMDYTAIGDTVNTSSRLESNAPGGTVYISRAVADRLAGRIMTTSLGSSIRLKGKAEGFEVLTLDEIIG